MITQEFLSQCSDEQINRGVAWLEVKSRVDEAISIDSRNLLMYALNFDLSSVKPYCSKPNDIMPIAFANAISLETHDGSLWWADALIIKDDSLGKTITSRELKNPLRAICEVYILMSVFNK